MREAPRNPKRGTDKQLVAREQGLIGHPHIGVAAKAGDDTTLVDAPHHAIGAPA